MKKIVSVLFCLIFTSIATMAKDEYFCPRMAPFYYGEVKSQKTSSYNELVNAIKKERLAISNALQLSDEQEEYKTELVRKNAQILDDKFYTLYQEQLKLNSLKSQKAHAEAIKSQEENVNNLKKEIETIIDQENKDFKKILDNQQKSKLNMIQNLESKAIKNTEKTKDYYKLNPKMRPFAKQI